MCGDGIVNSACGEECDPPGRGLLVHLQAASEALGTRHFSFGGSFYSSALGAAVAARQALHGAIDLVAGTPDANGVAPVTVAGPVYYSAAILGGQFGYLCVRVDCVHRLRRLRRRNARSTCNVTQDSMGPGTNGGPVQTTTGLGADGGPGAVELRLPAGRQPAAARVPEAIVARRLPAGAGGGLHHRHDAGGVHQRRAEDRHRHDDAARGELRVRHVDDGERARQAGRGLPLRRSRGSGRRGERQRAGRLTMTTISGNGVIPSTSCTANIEINRRHALVSHGVSEHHTRLRAAGSSLRRRAC